MPKKEIRVRANYLEYMRQRVSFKGSHNKRKSLILYALLSRERLSSALLYRLAGKGVSYTCVRSTLTRLVKFKYIGYTIPIWRDKQGNVVDFPLRRQYKLLTKGARFLYAFQKLEPEQYNAMVAEFGQRSIAHHA